MWKELVLESYIKALRVLINLDLTDDGHNKHQVVPWLVFWFCIGVCVKDYVQMSLCLNLEKQTPLQGLKDLLSHSTHVKS